MHRWMFASWMACAAPPAATPVAQQAPSPIENFLAAIATPLPGTERVRLSHRVVDARHAFTDASPFRIDVHLPPGTEIASRGIPTDLLTDDRALRRTLGLEDGSLVQLELPMHHRGSVDEVTNTIASFDPPRFCPVGQPCLPRNTRGRWFAFRVHNDTDITMLQVANPFFERLPTGGELPPTERARVERVLGIWLEADAPPLTEADRIVFAYSGHAPGKSTDWLGSALVPRVRARVDDTCASSDASCWEEIPPAETQGLELLAGPPAFVSVIAPLDAEVGEPMQVRVVALDERSNPSLTTGTVQLMNGTTPVGPPLSFTDSWSATTLVTPTEDGPLSLRAAASFHADEIHHWTYVWPTGERPHQRLTGDLHAHTGITGEFGFSERLLAMDHKGGFNRGADAFAYMHEVVGLEFGALSEHSVTAGSAVANRAPCASFPTADGAIDWWTASQQVAADVDGVYPNFTSFPAYEWHGNWRDTQYNAPLHRVVLFRDHDVGALPMLPGSATEQSPQCLFAFLDDAGRQPSDTLVIPHMMRALTGNRDWDLTYAPWDGLVPPERVAAYQRIGELFSSRSYAPGNEGSLRLSRFEGTEVEPAHQPWSFRYGWRDTAATLGVIGSSDDHQGMPGSDELYPATGQPDHSHEMGGIAVVLTPPGDRRQAIFDGLRSRATYASSGPRVWMDVRMRAEGVAHGMGTEVAVNQCTMRASIQLLAGMEIRDVTMWGAEVGGSGAYEVVSRRRRPGGEMFDHRFPVRNPAPAGGSERWLYYVQAYLGTDPALDTGSFADSHREAVWSSPIWVDWTGCE